MLSLGTQKVFLVPVLLLSPGRPEWMKDWRLQQGWVIPDACQGRQGAELSSLLLSATSHSCLALFFHPLLPNGLFEGGSLRCAYLELMLAEGKTPITYVLKEAEWICFPLFFGFFFFLFIAHCPMVLAERKIKRPSLMHQTFQACLCLAAIWRWNERLPGDKGNVHPTASQAQGTRFPPNSRN